MIFPNGLRRGQAIINFLEFLREKGVDNWSKDRDLFYIDDYEFDKHWDEFLKINNRWHEE